MRVGSGNLHISLQALGGFPEIRALQDTLNTPDYGVLGGSRCELVGISALGLGFRVQGSGFRVQSSEFRV